MSGRSAKKVILLAKKEVVYGTDPVPVGANAMLVSNLQFTPIVSDLLKRDTIKGFKGNGGQVLGQKYVKVTFDVEVGGHGGLVIGAVPAIDPLLCSCDLVATQVLAVVTITSAGVVATVAHVAHGFRVGDKVPISGCTQVEYNKTATIATVPTVDSYTYAVAGAPASPATGAPRAQTGRKYTPTPDGTALASTTLYGYQDGVLHVAVGARGNMSVELNTKGIPKFKYEFTGLHAPSSDAANPVGDFSAFSDPKAVNFDNTTNFALHGFTSPLESLSVNLNNNVVFRNMPGSQSILIPDREPSGQCKFEACTIAEKDFFTIAEDQTQGALAITHGVDNGNIVQIACPKVTISPPEYSESDSIIMMSCNLALMPNAGNDEIEITFR